MHELNLCLSIIKTLEARADNTSRINKVWLEVGTLAGVELDALRFSFPIAAANTIAANATLEIIETPGEAWCQSCQRDVTMSTCFAACPHCNGYNYQVIRGKELKIIKMEVI